MQATPAPAELVIILTVFALMAMGQSTSAPGMANAGVMAFALLIGAVVGVLLIRA